MRSSVTGVSATTLALRRSEPATMATSPKSSPGTEHGDRQRAVLAGDLHLEPALDHDEGVDPGLAFADHDLTARGRLAPRVGRQRVERVRRKRAKLPHVRQDRRRERGRARHVAAFAGLAQIARGALELERRGEPCRRRASPGSPPQSFRPIRGNMAISAVTDAVTHMSWSPAAAAPAKPRTGWTPPPVPSVPAVPVAAAGAGDALIQGSRDAAKQAFLFGLKIAFSDADRLSAARAYLNFAQGLSASDLQADPALGSLKALAQSIVARTQYHGRRSFQPSASLTGGRSG